MFNISDKVSVMSEGKKKNILPVYNFDEPIIITRYRGGATDIAFYAFLLSVIGGGIFLLLFLHDGKIKMEFEFWRTLIAFILSLPFVVIAGLLKEIKKYTRELAKKKVWTFEELKALTKKNDEQTRNTISHVLEVAFTVDPKCIKNWDELNS